MSYNTYDADNQVAFAAQAAGLNDWVDPVDVFFVSKIEEGLNRSALLSESERAFLFMNATDIMTDSKFSKKDANKLFMDYKIDLIPIVDKNSKVKDFISWNNFFGDTQKKKELDIPVIIMAGGQGDRLQPFTKVLPKPLIPINDKPIIEHVIENFLKFGIKNYYLSVNFKSRVLKAYFEESKRNYEISFLEEDKPLGTSGSLKLLKKHNLKATIFKDYYFDKNYK